MERYLPVIVAVMAVACDRTAGATADGKAPLLPAASAPAAATKAAPEGVAAATSKVEMAAYRVTLRPVGTYKKGQAAAFEVVLETKGDYHVNAEYPAKFKALESDAVGYAQPKLERTKDPGAFNLKPCAAGSDSCAMSVSVAFTPQRTGDVRVGGDFHVGVCTKDTCLVEKVTLELPIVVS